MVVKYPREMVVLEIAEMAARNVSKLPTTDAQMVTPSPWALRIPILVSTWVMLVALVLVASVGLYELQHQGLIYPGVSTFGIDLSGHTQEEAYRWLTAAFVYPDSVRYTFTDGQQTWQLTAAELGLRLDAVRTIGMAYEVGHSGDLFIDLADQLDAWLNGKPIPPQVVYDRGQSRRFLEVLAAQIDQPMRNAAVVMDGLHAVATASQIGRELDINATLEILQPMVLSLQGGEVPLVIHETRPLVWDATEAAQTINTILSGPITLFIENPLPGDPEPWVIDPETIARMLAIRQMPNQDGTARYEVTINLDALRSALEPLAEQLTVEPVNARYVFDDATGQLITIQPSIDGRRLDVDATIALVEERLTGANREIPMVFETVTPVAHTDATAEELGITELISQATTYFTGSSQVRRRNIEVAASRFHGLVIAPGEEFSFNRYLGDVSLESGFEPALIIYGDRTIEGVGGGICQVSTTAFQAAFYAGYPITERWPHGYRVSYYEVGEGPGMDATVYSPIVDFRFVNDTPYFLLIETYVNQANSSLTFKFYSTSMGREVIKEGPFISNIVPHGPTVYVEDPSLAPGQTRQVEWAVDGADVRVRRIVYQNGELLYDDLFESHYLPWNAVIHVAPGEIPPGAATPEPGQ